MEFEQVMQEVKRRAAERRAAHPEIQAELERLAGLPGGVEHYDISEFQTDLREANVYHNPGQLPPKTPFRFLKRLVLRLMQVYTREQTIYNAATVRTLNRLTQRVAVLSQHNTDLKHQLETFESKQNVANQQMRSEQEDTVLFIRTMERINAGPAPVPTFGRKDLDVALAEEIGRASFPNWLAFAARFRGGEEEIRRKQSVYVEVFRHHDPVIDIGCGRGELLELLRDADISALGIELDSKVAEYARSKGLDVRQADLFDYLSSLADESVGGFFCGQVIEHLDWPPLISLLTLMHRKLSIGGIGVLESPNPSCFNIYAESLYIDPTHRRPYHPLGMQFLCEGLGFVDVRVEYHSPVPDSNRLPFYSHFQDYAIIARK